MRSTLFRLLLVSAVTFRLAAQAAPGAAQGGQPSAPQPALTLRTASRIVLLDITATDGDGRPVHGLPQSAFQITDDRQPQAVTHFEENVRSAPAEQPAPALENGKDGVYSNDFVRHAPPVLNVLLLDISNLPLEDQMLLRLQLGRLIDSLPSDQPVAVYSRSAGPSVLFQDFTTSRPLLRAAINRAVPRIAPKNPDLDDVYTLHQIASTLSALPGRKNLLWFTGGAPLRFFGFVNIEAQPYIMRDRAAERAAYDELESARVSVYPIDARGLTIGNRPAMRDQQSAMEEVAHVTGGHAVINGNGIAEAASHILETDSSFYTLSYTPANFETDHKWHTVHVSVDRPGVKLAYREGYFSDTPQDRAAPVPPAASRERSRLLADGSLGRERGEAQSAPIVFQVRVLPASDARSGPVDSATLVGNAASSRHGSIPYAIQYAVPAEALAVQQVAGGEDIVLGVAAAAFNGDGATVAHTAEKATFHLKAGSPPPRPGVTLPFTQQIALHRGDLTLYLAIWDFTSGRMGTLQIPLSVESEKQ